MSLREIFRAERLPVLQNRMFRLQDEALASPTGDLILVEDSQTGLVYNRAFDSSKLVYDQDYQNEQAYSDFFKHHLEQVFEIIDRNLTGRPLIEVGCGKGYFLEGLQKRGFDITGIDPAYEGNNPKVITAPFRKGLGLSADGIILRHVLEHIPQPLQFLDEMADANGQRGMIYIEVPAFEWILQHRAWFDLFYEHVNYFRLKDFSRIFGKVYESGTLFGGQYLYVLADLASLRVPSADAAECVALPKDFLEGVQWAVRRIRQTPELKHAVWGGASKGVIFSLYLSRSSITPDFVIDINPAKQGRYLPVSGIKVSSPQEALASLSPGDNLFIMNSNYLDEIKAQSGNQLTYLKVEHE